jgi:hypothetical protein
MHMTPTAGEEEIVEESTSSNLPSDARVHDVASHGGSSPTVNP